MTDPIELPCDHCGKPERQHVEIVGMGKVCRMQGCTFSNAMSRALQSRIAEVGRLTERGREAMDHLFNAADLLEAEGWKAVASEKREIAQSLKAALSLQRRV